MVETVVATAPTVLAVTAFNMPLLLTADGMCRNASRSDVLQPCDVLFGALHGADVRRTRVMSVFGGS